MSYSNTQRPWTICNTSYDQIGGQIWFPPIFDPSKSGKIQTRKETQKNTDESFQVH